jgi:hypothetical protein
VGCEKRGEASGSGAVAALAVVVDSRGEDSAGDGSCKGGTWSVSGADVACRVAAVGDRDRSR